jgi:hypothetical protein
MYFLDNTRQQSTQSQWLSMMKFIQFLSRSTFVKPLKDSGDVEHSLPNETTPSTSQRPFLTLPIAEPESPLQMVPEVGDAQM